MGLNAAYTAFEVKNLEEAVSGIRGLGIRGVSVTIPFKTKVIAFLDQLEGEAKTIQSVNTIANEDGKLIGHNTDWSGALEALEERVDLKGKKVFLLGAGGTARAVAFALKKRDCQVFVFNRSLEKSRRLADELGFIYLPLSALHGVAGIDAPVIINATSVGMVPMDKESIFPEELLRPGMVVMDVVYRPQRTKLLRVAEERRCQTIDGLEMLARQGASQIEIWTGQKPEISQIKDDLRRALEKESK
jgi:shikimate dehydrogenase